MEALLRLRREVVYYTRLPVYYTRGAMYACMWAGASVKRGRLLLFFYHFSSLFFFLFLFRGR
jgi:hypothetical protein